LREKILTSLHASLQINSLAHTGSNSGHVGGGGTLSSFYL
jgi:hypothetical protein